MSKSQFSGISISLVEKIGELFNLRNDTDEAGTIDSIIKNVEFKSANAWTLVFAIFVASVGLNVNSAAVIIGAMLISPLMGPIVGAGLALGINDNELLRKSVRNLAIAVAISILTSTVYFFLSPLGEAQSELLARTQPTFYDVLIAFFGGATGIVASSRRERGTAVAGVAIATALMPPLCTAGFGLASGNWKYFLGALYLFTINSIFIALSTFIFVRYLRFKKVQGINQNTERRINRWVTVVATIVIIPSLVMAWALLKETSFSTRAKHFVKEEFNFPGTYVVGQEAKYNFKGSKLRVNLVGNTIDDAEIARLKEKMQFYRLEDAELDVQQYTSQQTRALSKDIMSVSEELSLKVADLEGQVKGFNKFNEQEVALQKELNTMMPTLSKVILARDGTSASVQWSRRPASADRKKVEEFIKVRLALTDINISHVVQM
jgi:uncharacterized hydrophobic protein (TIGR00271 family)